MSILLLLYLGCTSRNSLFNFLLRTYYWKYVKVYSYFEKVKKKLWSFKKLRIILLQLNPDVFCCCSCLQLGSKLLPCSFPTHSLTQTLHFQPRNKGGKSTLMKFILRQRRKNYCQVPNLSWMWEEIHPAKNDLRLADLVAQQYLLIVPFSLSSWLHLRNELHIIKNGHLGF